MQTIKTLALAVAAFLYTTAPARADVNAVVINFDDLNPGPKHIAVPDLYKGLNWSNFWVEAYAGDHAGLEGYGSGVVTPPNAVYVDGASGPGLLSTPDNSMFVLDSAFFTSSASNTNGSATHSTVSHIDVTGIGLDPTPYFARIAVNDWTPTLYNFGWVVSAVQFQAELLSPVADPNSVPFDIVIDNLSVVPEPGAIFLFGAVGVALLPLIRRRFRQV